MTINTIEEIYAAINPLPAKMSAKGKVNPRASIEFEANANVTVWLKWSRTKARYDWEYDSKCFICDTADNAISEATAFIDAMPDAKTAKLHEFMGHLGKVIDSGRELGIDVDYLNPLTDTMKRLSENIITYKPGAA